MDGCVAVLYRAEIGGHVGASSHMDGCVAVLYRAEIGAHVGASSHGVTAPRAFGTRLVRLLRRFAAEQQRVDSGHVAGSRSSMQRACWTHGVVVDGTRSNTL